MLYLLLFIEGFIGLTYQLFFFRQLVSQVGSSSIVTAWVIGAFLGALAYGYETGGKPQAEPLRKFGKNLLLTAIIGGTLMSSMSIDVLFNFGLDIGLSRLTTLIIYCIVAVAPIAYLMGQSLPLLMQQFPNKSTASEQGGRALFLSTIGSMLGAIVPVTFLAPYIGATLTVFLNTLLAIAFGTYLLGLKRPGLLLGAILSQAVLLAPYYFLSSDVFTSTAYSDIYLVTEGDEKMMYTNGLVMSSQDRYGNNSSDYISDFQHKLIEQNIRDKDILVLGAGGFMAHTYNPNNNRFTYVDIDGDLAQWAQEHFNFKKESAKIVVDDARSFLLKSDKQWDVIFVDTYASRFAMPEHLITYEFFQLAKSKLTSKGILSVNAVINPQYTTQFARRFHTTLTQAMPFCQVEQVTPSNTIANVHYWCFNFSNDPTHYSDDKNTISQDVWKARSQLDMVEKNRRDE